MTTEDQESTESGKEFRAKAESWKAEAEAYREAYASTFKHVKASDLAGVGPTEIAAKAQEIEQARKAEREAIAREFLVERGLPEGDLDTALAKLTTGAPEVHEGDDAANRIAALGSLGGTVPPVTPDTSGLFGIDRIRAALGNED